MATCISRIQRHRRLTTSRSTSLVRASNVNPFIGHVGKPRSESEITLYGSSMHRKSSETSSNFEVFIPDPPKIPINASVHYQIITASIPNTFRYWRNTVVTLTTSFYSSMTSTTPTNVYVSTKTFDGVFFYDEQTSLNYVANWVVNGVTYSLFMYNESRLSLQPNTLSLPAGVAKAVFRLSGTTLNYGKPFGFDEETYTWEVYSSSSYYTPIPLKPYRAIPLFAYLRVNDTLYNVLETEYYELDTTGKAITNEGNVTNSDILCTIPITAGYGDLIVYQPALDTYLETQLRKDMKNLQFSLTDENGYILETDLDWTFQLRIVWKEQDFGAR